MCVKVLLYDYNMLASEESIIRGYVFIEGRRIMDVGEGEPPSDYFRCDMVLPGRGSVLAQGFVSAVTHLTLYPFRGLIGRRVKLRKVWETVAKLSYEEALSLAAAGLKHLVEAGVTSVVSLDPHPQAVYDLLRETGVGGMVLVVEDWIQNGLREASLTGDIVVRRASMTEVSGGEEFERIGDENETLGMKWKGKIIAASPRFDVQDIHAVGVGHHWSYDPRFILAVVAKGDVSVREYKVLSMHGSEIIYGVSTTKLEKNAPANLIALRYGDVPLTLLDSTETVVRDLLSPMHAPRIELVISNGNIIVDAGQCLCVKDAYLRRAWNTASRVLGSLLSS